MSWDEVRFEAHLWVMYASTLASEDVTISLRAPLRQLQWFCCRGGVHWCGWVPCRSAIEDVAKRV